jgi:WD40 repeat protein
VVSGSDDKTVRIWDAATGAMVCEHRDCPNDIAQSIPFHPNGWRIISSPTDHIANANCDHWQLQLASEYQFILQLLSPLSHRNGWLLGSNGELLFGVPSILRHSFWWPRTVAVMGARITTVDLKQFCFGNNWAKIFQYT